MGYSYENELALEEFMDTLSSFSSAQSWLSGMLGIASYVFVALGLYTIAKRRGIGKAWLAWVPVLDVWILGSISDQFRYVVKGENKSKRKVLLVLNLIQTALKIVLLVLAVGMVIGVVSMALRHVSEEQLLQELLGYAAGLAGVSLVMLAFVIAQAVFYYMALYDLFTSCEPSNNVLYLVLCIIPMVSTIALPLLLFLCREKDGGMPPRRELPEYEAPPAGWQQEADQAKQEWHEESPLWKSEPDNPSDPWNQSNE